MISHEEAMKDPRFTSDYSVIDGEGNTIVREVDWAPGNGTRYHVVFSKLGSEWLVSLVNFNKCMVVSDNGKHISWRYVNEKLRFDNDNDPAHMAMLIGEILERPYTEVNAVLFG